MNTQRFRHSISLKIITFEVLLLVILGLTAGAFMYKKIRERYYAGIAEQAHTMGLAFREIIAAAPEFLSKKENMLQGMIISIAATLPDAERLTIVDRDLITLADSDTSKIGKVTDKGFLKALIENPGDTKQMTYRKDKKLLVLSYSLLGRYDRKLRSAVKGAVSYELDLTNADIAIRRLFIGLMLPMTFILTLFWIASQLFLNRILIKRIIRLGKSAEIIGRGDFSSRLPVKRSDEISGLALQFNRMAEYLETADIKIKDHNKELELTIAQRTAELAIINIQLSTELEERKAIGLKLKEANEIYDTISWAQTQYLTEKRHKARICRT